LFSFLTFHCWYRNFFFFHEFWKKFSCAITSQNFCKWRYPGGQIISLSTSACRRILHVNTICCHININERSIFTDQIECSFSKEQSVLPEDGRIIGTCRS
jgi:hypothetical protein